MMTIGVDQVRVRVLPDGRMTRRDAAKYLGLKEKTLAMWSVAGKGPPVLHVGGRCFYRQSDLDEYVAKGN
jgi:predicted site-specific integrase-resolvase